MLCTNAAAPMDVYLPKARGNQQAFRTYPPAFFRKVRGNPLRGADRVDLPFGDEDRTFSDQPVRQDYVAPFNKERG
jgi:hypothetical protein